jgi:hypothetical protein
VGARLVYPVLHEALALLAPVGASQGEPMGHLRLHTLPKTQKWEHVVGLIAGGADVERIAAASADAAEHGLERASEDQGLGPNTCDIASLVSMSVIWVQRGHM